LYCRKSCKPAARYPIRGIAGAVECRYICLFVFIADYKLLTMKLKLTLLLCCFICSFLAFGQSISPTALNMAGGYLNGGYYQYEYSVGEMSVIETLTGSTNMITHGVLQPLTDKPFGNNTASAWSNDEIKIFPVPTRGRVEVDILSKQQGRVRMQLVDGLGQVIRTAEFDYAGLGNIQIFDITTLASANYSLRITLDPKPGFVKKSGAFKILKIN
jgi:hypothetical protein